MLKNLLNLATAVRCLTPFVTSSLASDKPVLTIYTYDSFASEWRPGPEIEKAFPKPIPIDYSRLENAFAKLLLDSRSKENLRKYQFICDENERWIYRCNMDSGEIECFSMSSNKLRLLSSIK